jgi:hypothetical protein
MDEAFSERLRQRSGSGPLSATEQQFVSEIFKAMPLTTAHLEDAFAHLRNMMRQSGTAVTMPRVAESHVLMECKRVRASSGETSPATSSAKSRPAWVREHRPRRTSSGHPAGITLATVSCVVLPMKSALAL